MCIIAKSLFSRSFNKWLLKLTCFHEKNLFPVIQIGVVLQWRPPVWTLKCPKTSSACQRWERYIQSRCPCRWSGAWRQRFHRRTDYAPVKLCLSWMPLRQTALCCNCIAACYIVGALHIKWEEQFHRTHSQFLCCEASDQWDFLTMFFAEHS